MIGNRRGILIVVLCALAFLDRSPGWGSERTVRVAVLHGTYDHDRHQGEHDGALKQLGWEFEKYPNTELKRLTGQLGKYDLVLANPLFNFGEVQDYGAYADQWRTFMQNGGAIVLTDCNYPPCVDWLERIEGSFAASTEGCKAQTPATESTPRHPLHFLPNTFEGHNTWAHLVLNGSGWEVLSRCGEGNPVSAVHRLGKGLMFLTSLWPLRAEALENVWVNLQLQRIGFAATRFDMPNLKVGAGEIRLALKRIAEDSTIVGLDFAALPETGSTVRCTHKATFGPGQERLVRLPYRLSVRGATTVSLRVTEDNREVTLLERKVTLPQLLNLHLRSPVYRGLAPVSRWTGKVVLGVEIVPDKEDLGKLSLRTTALDSEQRLISQNKPQALSKRSFEFPVDVGKVLPGEYSIRSELVEGRRTLASQEVRFSVLEELPAQVVIDDDLNTIVNGKPFFPLALYHVGLEDLPKVAALGMNAVQGWGGNVANARKFLDEAQRNGMKVLLEMGTLVSPGRGANAGPDGAKLDEKGIEEHVRVLKDHPALLVWYVRDEPEPGDHDNVLRANELFHRLDQNHPTYLVSCIPQEFGSQAQLSDILAVDPYPLPFGPVAMVANWADLAWKATKGEKPVWLIPQLHDQTSYNLQPPDRGAHPPTPAQERCMTYLSLVHGAKGIVWYPWDDGPNMGARYHPQLQEELQRLCSEIRVLSPALLSKNRRQFMANTAKVHGMVCGSGGTRFVLLVNATTDGQEVACELPEARAGAMLHEAFSEGSVRLKGKRLELSFEPYQVKVYRLGSVGRGRP